MAVTGRQAEVTALSLSMTGCRPPSLLEAAAVAAGGCPAWLSLPPKRRLAWAYRRSNQWQAGGSGEGVPVGDHPTQAAALFSKRLILSAAAASSPSVVTALVAAGIPGWLTRLP